MKTFSVIALCFLLAMMLSILPVPHWAIWLLPQWVVMVLIFWALAMPYRVSVELGFLLGLLMDVLHNTLLGEHALALALVAYVVVKCQLRISHFTLWQQAIIVFLIVLIYQSILYWIQGFLGQPPNSLWYWVPALTSMILWPWLFVLLRDYRRRFA